MDRVPSNNLDNLLLALARLEYRDFVGVKPGMAESLIKLFEVMEAMLDFEIKCREINRSMPPVKRQAESGRGSGSNGTAE